MDIYDELMKIGVKAGSIPVNEVYTKERYGSERAARAAWERDTNEDPVDTAPESAWDREVRELRQWKEGRDGGTPQGDQPGKRQNAMKVALRLIENPAEVASVSQRLSPVGRKTLRKTLITISQRAEALVQNHLADQGQAEV